MERKHNSEIGRKTDGDDGTGIIFKTRILAFFHDKGKILLVSEALKMLARERDDWQSLVDDTLWNFILSTEM